MQQTSELEGVFHEKNSLAKSGSLVTKAKMIFGMSDFRNVQIKLQLGKGGPENP